MKWLFEWFGLVRVKDAIDLATKAYRLGRHDGRMAMIKLMGMENIPMPIETGGDLTLVVNNEKTQ